MIYYYNPTAAAHKWSVTSWGDADLIVNDLIVIDEVHLSWISTIKGQIAFTISYV